MAGAGEIRSFWLPVELSTGSFFCTFAVTLGAFFLFGFAYYKKRSNTSKVKIQARRKRSTWSVTIFCSFFLRGIFSAYYSLESCIYLYFAKKYRQRKKGAKKNEKTKPNTI